MSLLGLDFDFLDVQSYSTLTALRFLFMVTLRKPDVVIHLPKVARNSVRRVVVVS